MSLASEFEAHRTELIIAANARDFSISSRRLIQLTQESLCYSSVDDLVWAYPSHASTPDPYRAAGFIVEHPHKIGNIDQAKVHLLPRHDIEASKELIALEALKSIQDYFLLSDIGVIALPDEFYGVAAPPIVRLSKRVGFTASLPPYTVKGRESWHVALKAVPSDVANAVFSDRVAHTMRRLSARLHR